MSSDSRGEFDLQFEADDKLSEKKRSDSRNRVYENVNI